MRFQATKFPLLKLITITQFSLLELISQNNESTSSILKFPLTCLINVNSWKIKAESKKASIFFFPQHLSGPKIIKKKKNQNRRHSLSSYSSLLVASSLSFLSVPSPLQLTRKTKTVTTNSKSYVKYKHRGDIRRCNYFEARIHAVSFCGLNYSSSTFRSL